MSERVCARCGASMENRDPRSRHCSSLCRNRDYEGAVVGTVRQCRFCGCDFAPTKGTHVFCNRSCRARADLNRNREAYNRRNAARRARERGAVVVDAAPFTREQVFDRDGWICQLCLAPIDWNLTGRSPLAPALDHVRPLSRGGSHTLDNVQASHFGCNARKSAREDVLMLPVPKREVV